MKLTICALAALVAAVSAAPRPQELLVTGDHIVEVIDDGIGAELVPGANLVEGIGITDLYGAGHTYGGYYGGRRGGYYNGGYYNGGFGGGYNNYYRPYHGGYHGGYGGHGGHRRHYYFG